MEGWKYYNHALIPTSAPHEDVNLTPIEDRSIWKEKWNGYPLLARWTSDYNCNMKTNWYYCIKDTPFDINALKSKQRYEINKGRKYFYVSIINPQEYVDEIYNIQIEAFKTYPKEYRPQIKYQELKKEIYNNWNDKIIFAAFDNSTKKMVSYSIFEKKTSYIEWTVLKSIPAYEKYKVNAIIIAESLEYFNHDIQNGLYIHGGEKNISHQTNFQNYLEYLFDFKKIYCKLHLIYRPGVSQLINIIYPFKEILKKFNSKMFHNITAVMLMEEIVRNQ